jgi:hypothetical protein
MSMATYISTRELGHRHLKTIDNCSLAKTLIMSLEICELTAMLGGGCVGLTCGLIKLQC